MQSFFPDSECRQLFLRFVFTRERERETQECQQVFNFVEDVTTTQGVDTTATCESAMLLVLFQHSADCFPCIPLNQQLHVNIYVIFVTALEHALKPS